MKKQEYLGRTGSMQQMAYVRPLRYSEGRAAGMNSYEVKNGPLHFHVAADKCLDITDLEYKGINLSFLSKGGLQGPQEYDTFGTDAIRSIMGGLVFTCGLDNICAPCTVEGTNYPMHGRMRLTPAEHTGSSAAFEQDIYVMRLWGQMRQASLFGENMVLHRSIETKLGEKSILIRDIVENQSFKPEPLMLLYHCNFGYPFIDETCELVLPTHSTTGREEHSQQHIGSWASMPAPIEGEPEYVYLHEMAAGPDNLAHALIINHSLQLGLLLSYSRQTLPYFMQWKSVAAGDYVLGLEPSNASVYGKLHHINNGSVHTLAPFATQENLLRFTILDGADELEKAKSNIQQIKENEK